MRKGVRSLVLVLVVLFAASPLLASSTVVHSGPSVTGPRAPSTTVADVLTALGYGVAIFGAIRIKDTGALAKKFVQRAGAAGGDYKDGVAAAGQDWETNTKNSEDNYAAGVTAAIGDKRFGKGVANAGAAKWVAKASTLGASRYPTGVAAAEGDWSKGTQPYLDRLKSLDLPPRRPKGDPGNAARSNAVASALRAMKVGR